MFNEKDDLYYDLYKESKITVKELRQLPELEGMSDEELEVLADQLFDLAVAAQKIIIEQ
jgi:hypothetical protein